MWKSLIAGWLLLLADPAQVVAAPGDLDPGFGSGGIVTVAGAGTFMLEPDGGMVVSIARVRDGELVRLGSDGGVDPAFGAGGRTVLPAAPGAIVRQPSGKLVVSTLTWNEIYSHCWASLVRVDATGSIDVTFGTGGSVPIHSLGPCQRATGPYFSDAAVQSTGHVVLAMMRIWHVFGGIVDLVRHTVDGPPDLAFGPSGFLPAGRGMTPSVAVDASDRILVASFVDDFANGAFPVLRRFEAQGTGLDATFGQGGLAYAPPGAESLVDKIVVQADGKIVTVGWGVDPYAYPPGPLTVVRYLANGAPDSSFGTMGAVTVRPALSDRTEWQPSAIAIQPDGAIVVAAHMPRTHPGIVLVRLLANGRVDTSFGNNGSVLTPFVGDTPGILAMDLQRDGNILVLASTGHLLRYLGGAAAAGPVVEVPALSLGALALLVTLVAAGAAVALRRGPPGRA